MTAQYEALLLIDQHLGDGLGWHLHPEVLPVAGWWPDGQPALDPDPDRDEEGQRMLVGVIEKRQPEEPDSEFLEDHPAVGVLIDTATTLNDILWPHRSSVIADAIASGSEEAQAAAIAARIRQGLGPERVGRVLQLAQEIVQRRAAEGGGGS